MQYVFAYEVFLNILVLYLTVLLWLLCHMNSELHKVPSLYFLVKTFPVMLCEENTN